MPGLYTHPHVQQVIDLHYSIITRQVPYRTVREQLERFTGNLIAAYHSGHPAFFHEVRNYHPALSGKPDAEILKCALTIADFRTTIAREYGFTDWEEVERAGGLEFDPDFEAAIDALVQGDFDRLQSLVRAKPTLLTLRSPYGHRAALLHYAGSNGVELWRQTVPSNLVAMTAWLIEEGADPLLDSNIYGGGATLIELVNTSAHPWEAGIGRELLELLAR